MHFVDCCKNGEKASSDFNFAGPFNEMVVMGNRAIRLQSLQKTLLWDSEKMKVTNISPNEELTTAELTPFSSDIVTRSVERQSQKWVKWNALNLCEQWIKHNYRAGWDI